MEYVDFSELKLPVGRPEEGPQEERVDLTRYIAQQEFTKRWTRFYKYWEQVIRHKAQRVGKDKYISYMEEFYGEVLDKFLSLPERRQDEVARSQFPIRKLYELTNLSSPNLFEEEQENKDFIEVLKHDQL